MTYAVIFERGRRNWSCYAPDLPGCVATGKTLSELKQVMREAIAFHIEGLQLGGCEVPAPTCVADNLEIPEVLSPHVQP